MKVVKVIKIDADKCSGCRACEAICSAYHAEPKYSIVNPERSRIRIFRDEANDLYVPILAGAYTDAECIGRTTTIIRGKRTVSVLSVVLPVQRGTFLKSLIPVSL